MILNTIQLKPRLLIACALTMVVATGTAVAGGHKSKLSSQPASSNTIVDVAASAGQFNTLIAAAKAAGLADALSGEGPLTVFAPTDEAFAKLPAGTVETLLQPENKDQLVAILTYHVAPAKLKASDVVARNRVATLNGKQPRITVDGSNVRIDQANIVKVDVAASNGVIHVIDQVLIPPESQANKTNTQALIELAIDKGAPMFNHGQAGACADLYEVTAASLLRMDDSLSSDQRRVLTVAMNSAERTHSERKRAWLMRDALDAVYDGQSKMQMTAAN